jgi:hypothetical protein
MDHTPPQTFIPAFSYSHVPASLPVKTKTWSHKKMILSFLSWRGKHCSTLWRNFVLSAKIRESVSFGLDSWYTLWPIIAAKILHLLVVSLSLSLSWD